MIKKYLFEPDYRVMVLYRLSERWLKKKRLLKFLAHRIRRHLKVKYCIEFNNISDIGEGLKIFHFNGIVIGHGCVIGKNVTIYNSVTLGGKRDAERTIYPTIGDNVIIYPGARVIGGIKIGDNSIIGPNVVVYKDVPDGAVVVGCAPRVIEK